MATKKKKDEKVIVIKNDTTPENKWMLSPVNYSQIGGNFTMVQQRVLAGILEKVQENIVRSINGKEDNKRFPSLFSDDEMRGDTMELELEPSYFGISPEHYDYLEEALKDLANIRIAFPKVSKSKDHLNYIVAPLFARLEIPMGNKRRKGKVRVVMLNENLNDFLSMDKGYTLYLSRVTRISKKVRTPRIYQYLSTYQEIGHKKVLYEDFCKFLGIDDETSRADRLNKINQLLNDNSITQKEANERLEALAKWENPFRKFSKVKSQILESAKAELDSFTADGVDPHEEVDFTFEYEPLYEGVSKRGNPSHIRFTIIKKRLALEHDMEQTLKRQRYALINTLTTRYNDLNSFDLRELINNVNSDEFDEFKNFCYTDVAKIIENKQPDYVGAYVMTMIENWISDRRKRKNRTEQTECIFLQPTKEQPAGDFRPGEAADKWLQLVTCYDGDAKSLLLRAEYLGLYNGSFYVALSADDQREWNKMDAALSDFYSAARAQLSISRFAPPVIKTTKKK